MTKKKAIILSSAAVAVIAALLFLVFKIVTDTKESYSFEKKPVKDVIAEMSASAGMTYQNLVLPKEIQLPEAENVYILTADRKGSADPRVQIDKLCEVMCGVPLTEVTSENKTGLRGEVSKKGVAEYYSSNSFLWADYSEDPELSWEEWQDDRIVAVYDLETADLTGISYDFRGAPYPAAEAVAYAKKEVSDKLAEFMPSDTETRAKELIVFESEKEGHYYYITFEHYVDGLPLLRSGSGDSTQVRIFPSQFEVHIHEPNKLNVIKNYYYSDIVDKRPVKEMITLGSALSCMEQELAPLSSYEITEVRLEYVAVDTVIGGADKLEYRPAWCLTVGELMRDNSLISPKMLLICDAVTGEISCWNDRKFDYDLGAPKLTGIRNEEIYTVSLRKKIKQQYGLSDDELEALLID